MSVEIKKSLFQVLPYSVEDNISFIKEKYGISKEDILRLDLNENRHGYSPNVNSVIEKYKGELSYYPETDSMNLRKKLAKIHQIEKENIVIGSGSFELITLIASTYLEKGDEAITVHPSFFLV